MLLLSSNATVRASQSFKPSMMVVVRQLAISSTRLLYTCCETVALFLLCLISQSSQEILFLLTASNSLWRAPHAASVPLPMPTYWQSHNSQLLFALAPESFHLETYSSVYQLGIAAFSAVPGVSQFHVGIDYCSLGELSCGVSQRCLICFLPIICSI